MKNLTVTLSLENKKVVWNKSWILSTKKCTNPAFNKWNLNIILIIQTGDLKFVSGD